MFEYTAAEPSVSCVQINGQDATWEEHQKSRVERGTELGSIDCEMPVVTNADTAAIVRARKCMMEIEQLLKSIRKS